MTRTITDLQPFIHAHAFAQEENRTIQRAQVFSIIRWLILRVLYLPISLKIRIDTGIPPSDWRFLVMFLPVFLLGEQAFIEMCRRWTKGYARSRKG